MSARLVRGRQGLLVRVAGELDLDTAPVLDQVLCTATRLFSAQRDHTTAWRRDDLGLRVDLSDVQSVDAAGLAPLHAAQQRLLLQGRHLHLTLVPALVLRVLTQLPDPELLSAADLPDPRPPRTAQRRLAPAPRAPAHDHTSRSA